MCVQQYCAVAGAQAADAVFLVLLSKSIDVVELFFVCTKDIVMQERRCSDLVLPLTKESSQVAFLGDPVLFLED